MELFVLFSLAGLIYVYFGYFIILYLVKKLVHNFVFKKDILPKVSLIISAYNEEDIIEQKIKNSLELDYPKDKLEIIVANDGSKDKTSEIVKKYPEIKLLDYKENEGKTQTQNKAVKEASGEILVFSDANAMYNPDAIKKIVRNFADKSVGAVCGELRYKDINDSGAADGEGLYWKYERILKKWESNIYSTLGANGSIYAIRKELYEPLPADIISDFVEPLMIVKRGYRCIYEPEAISFEKPEGDFKKEFKRKVRIITRSLRGFLYIKDLVKFNFIGFALISHKLLRWLAPIFMILLFISNLLYHKDIYLYFLFGQVIFYGFALLGLKFKNKLFYIPSYFTMVNYAALKAIIKFIKGEKYISWNTSDR